MRYIQSEDGTEELLRASLIAAKDSLDAAREAVQTRKPAQGEGMRAYQIAIERYAIALRRFSHFVIDGEVPPDLTA